MPPKRKQIDDAVVAPTTSTRTTRQSTRAGTNSKKSTTRGSAKTASTTELGDDSDATESVYSVKKAKTGGSSKKTATTKGRKKGVQGEGDLQAARKTLPPVDYVPVNPPVPVVQETSKSVLPSKKKIEPYTPQRALDLFNKYSEDAADVIDMEGFEKLCKDTNMPMDEVRPLIFAWQMQAKEMGRITKDEWVQGMATLKIASTQAISIAVAELDDLLFKGKQSNESGKEYDRATYNTYASNSKAAFQKLYMFLFTLVKPEQSKNIDMETSLAFWTVLLVPKYPLMKEIVDFIREHQGTYKATNRDLWSMMLEFCETVNPTLQDYEADGAWPTLLDDFVTWKTKRTNGPTDEQMDVIEN